MCVVNAWNVIASASLRFGFGPLPEMGAVGIPLGTLSARILGGLIVLVLLRRGRSGLRLRGRDLKYRWSSIVRLLRVGVPAGLDGMLMWTCAIIFLRIISGLAAGEAQAATVAAHFVAMRVEALSYLPAFAWATAAATIVGQSLGAGMPERAMRAGHLAALQGAGMCFVMGILYFIFAPQIYWVFNSADYARVAAIGVPALRIEAFFQVPLGLMIIYTFALRGAGDTKWPLLFTFIGMAVVRLPLGYLGGIVLHGGLIGAWVGMFGDMTCRAILSTLRFSRGKWQRIRV
jgi:putative MATE family efflux protein